MRVLVIAVLAGIVGFVLVSRLLAGPAIGSDHRFESRPGAMPVEDAIRVVLQRGQALAADPHRSHG